MFDFFKRVSTFDNIKYYDEPHAYMINGKQAISVTTLLGAFKDKFDTEKWLNKKAGEKLKESYYQSGEDSQQAFERAKKELAAEWDYKRSHGQYEGTLFHSYMENMLANKIKPDDESGKETASYESVRPTIDKMKYMGRKFYKKYVESGRLIPVRSELVVGSEEHMLAGQIDQLFYDTELDCLTIYDWKTNTEFKRSNRYNRLKYCLENLDECEMNVYSLQLHTYKFLFESGTGIKLSHCPQIVWINENNHEAEIINCVDMTEEVGKMLDFKKENPDLFGFRQYVPPAEPVFEEEIKSMGDLFNFDF